MFIDGHGPYPFLLDTGSSISSVSSRLARTLHLPVTGRTAQIKGIASTQKVPIVVIRAWKVGHVGLTPEKVPVVDSSAAIGSAGGLLGSDELSQFGAVTQDFRHHQLRLSLP